MDTIYIRSYLPAHLYSTMTAGHPVKSHTHTHSPPAWFFFLKHLFVPTYKANTGLFLGLFSAKPENVCFFFFCNTTGASHLWLAGKLWNSGLGQKYLGVKKSWLAQEIKALLTIFQRAPEEKGGNQRETQGKWMGAQRWDSRQNGSWPRRKVGK